MDARQPWILLQYRLIFLGRLVPFSLYFQGFGVRARAPGRRSRVLCQLLRGPGGKIRIGMDGQIQDIRVTRKVTGEDLQEGECRIRLVQAHSAVHAIDGHIPFQFLVRHLRKALLQRWQRLRAMAGFRQLDNALYEKKSGHGMCSPAGRRKQKPSRTSETRKLPDQAGACMV